MLMSAGIEGPNDLSPSPQADQTQTSAVNLDFFSMQVSWEGETCTPGAAWDTTTVANLSDGY